MNTISGSSSTSSSNPSALTSQCRLSFPIVVPATRNSSPSARTATRSRFVKSREARRRRDLPRTQRLDQRVLVDELAAGGVDQPDAVPHARQRLLVDPVARLG